MSDLPKVYKINIVTNLETFQIRFQYILSPWAKIIYWNLFWKMFRICHIWSQYDPFKAKSDIRVMDYVRDHVTGNKKWRHGNLKPLPSPFTTPHWLVQNWYITCYPTLPVAYQYLGASTEPVTLPTFGLSTWRPPWGHMSFAPMAASSRINRGTQQNRRSVVSPFSYSDWNQMGRANKY